MTIEEFAGGSLRLHRARIARIELHAPERRNAMSQAMWAALPEICDAIEAEPDIRVVLLTAATAGDRAIFCPGADITEFEAVYADAESTRAYNASVRQAQARLKALPRAVIAMIRGACVGGGAGLALAADLRFADDSARIGITPARLGLAYSPEDTAQLLEKTGPAMARDILFSARLLDAEEAHKAGLIDRIYPAETLETRTLDYARGLSELSLNSIRAAKTIINGLTDPAGPDLPRLQQVFEESFTGADFREGRAAFLERRKPDFG